MNKNYYNIHEWMITELGLRDTDLQAYAIIYSATKDKDCACTVDFIAGWIGTNVKNVVESVTHLLNQGLVEQRAGIFEATC